jgi:hypothetical protein
MKKRILDSLDFTVIQYEKLCRSITESKYDVVTIADHLRNSKRAQNKNYIILRHDVDRTPQRSLDIAIIENKCGLKATYYFRGSTYNTAIMDKMASLGHEIGFHYETLDKSKGDMEKAVYLFKRELKLFRERYDIKTVCAHGNPLTKYDNKNIWKHIKFADLDLEGEAFLSIDFNQFAYFSDSGRTWDNNKAQKMPGKILCIQPSMTPCKKNR